MAAVPAFDPSYFLISYLQKSLPQDPADLQAAAPTKSNADFANWFGELPEGAHQALEERLGKAALTELVSLAKERDVELFWAGALDVARRLEREDRIEASLSLFQGISNGAPEAYAQLKDAADQSSKVLQGQGEFGGRFEFLLGRFTRELSDPWTVAAFGAGSLVFRATKLAAMSRLWAGPARGFLPGRLAAEWLATGAAIGMEAPTFLATLKLGHQLAGRAQDWRNETLAKEAASVALTLLALRGFGSLGEKIGEGQYFGKATTTAIPQVAMLGGIFAAQGAEELLGLKAASNRPTFLADGFVTYLQFLAGGRLAEEALGPRFQTWQRQMDWRSSSLGDRGGRWESPLPALATEGGGRIPVSAPSLSDIVRSPMMNERFGDKNRPPYLQLLPGRGKSSASDASAPPSASGPRSPSGPKSAGRGEEQTLDLSSARMLRSKPMDEKDRKFQADVEAVVLGSASEARRKDLEKMVLSKLPGPRRQELVRSLEALPPELVDLFGSAASEMPWQSLARAFAEMKLIRTSPGEIAEPPPSSRLEQPWREAIADELRSDHRQVFGTSLPGAPESLNAAVSGLSEPSASLLGYRTQNPMTRLLTAQRLELPGMPAESAILEAYRNWLNRSPESE